MKPLDLERFEGVTPGPWFLPAQGEIGMVYGGNETEFGPSRICRIIDNPKMPNLELIAAAPDLLAELKALRKWRQTVEDAFTQLDDGLHDAQTPHEAADVYREFVEKWNTAEMELNDGKL